MSYDWEAWKNVKASDRVKLHDEVAAAFRCWRQGDKLKVLHIDTPQHFNLLRELAFGDSHFCDCCEEPRPDVMCYEGADMDDDATGGIEGEIVSEYDYRVCAWCVQDKREETVCDTCGVSRWNTHEWIKDDEGEYVKVPRRCTSKSGEHTMILKHPYKGAEA